MDSWIAFHSSYIAPISLPGVHLTPCTAMNCERLYAAILELLCQLPDNLALMIPSEACFHGDGKTDCAYHGTGDIKHQRYIAQHTCPGTLSRHFLHRTTKIDVEHIGMRLLLHDFGCLHHGVNVTSINLYSHRPFCIRHHNLVETTVDRTDQGFRTDEFGINHGCAKLTAQKPKCTVSHILHRCEQNGFLTQIHISYFHDVVSY